MYLKKNGTVLISTLVILALMLTLGSFMFRNTRNNNELSSVYEFEKDIYDFNKDEEESLYKCMKELNTRYKEKQLNQEDCGIEVLLKDKIYTDNYKLTYINKTGKIILEGRKVARKREILYTVKEEKIILIPTCKFEGDDV